MRLTTYHPCSAERQEIRGLNLAGPPWAIRRPVVGETFTFTFTNVLNYMFNIPNFILEILHFTIKKLYWKLTQVYGTF